MKYLIAAAALLLAISSMSSISAQRGGRSSPFSEFHKKADLAIGQPAPQLRLQDSSGDEVDLRDYLGRWVFIEFGSYT